MGAEREGRHEGRVDIEKLRAMSWAESMLEKIKEAKDVKLAYYIAGWLMQDLVDKGALCNPVVRVLLPANGSLPAKDFVMADVLCPEPLVVVKVKSSAPTAEKAEEALAQLLKAVEAAEKSTGRRAELKILAVQTAPEEVAKYLAKRAQELGITLILGRPAMARMEPPDP
ncbi:MAG: hypothetical protein JZD41_02510 [Thermoproteus sp.]|nr:hypothetical protein [Thermoproteus sp.]